MYYGYNYNIESESYSEPNKEEEIMRKIWLIIPILLLVIGCGEEPLVGNWERFGDDAEGTIVQVEKVGKTHHSKLLKVSGILKELGFAERDIKWRDIERVRPNKWKGKDLIKIVDASGKIASVEYKDVYFTLLPDGTLEVRKFAKEEEIVGTVQKWRRIQ